MSDTTVKICTDGLVCPDRTPCERSRRCHRCDPPKAGIEVPAPSEREAFEAWMLRTICNESDLVRMRNGYGDQEVNARWSAWQARAALSTPPLDTPSQDSQHVLKAEPATADATDRETPAHASPVGGPMGAWQPAAAGPVGSLSTPPLQERDAPPPPLLSPDELPAERSALFLHWWHETARKLEWVDCLSAEVGFEAGRRTALNYQGRQTGVVQGCSPDPDAPATSSSGGPSGLA